MSLIPVSEGFSLILVEGQRANWSDEEELSWIETTLPTDAMEARAKRMECAVEAGDGAR